MLFQADRTFRLIGLDATVCSIYLYDVAKPAANQAAIAIGMNRAIATQPRSWSNFTLRERVKTLGEYLHGNAFPCVRAGGLLVPVGPSGTQAKAGQEKFDASVTERRPTARPRKGSARREGSTGRSSNSSSSAIVRQLRDAYEVQVDAVRKAYPSTKVWQREDGMWLLTESMIVEGLRKRATFLILVPYISGIRPHSWGFWSEADEHIWIGPRHTNFPDGSICAYTPTDGTWLPGGDLVTLIDLYTLWAFRHLHLEMFLWWPGHQTAPHAYERMLEFQGNEYCGCESLGLFYEHCCKSADFAQNIAVLAADFRRQYTCQLIERRPPNLVLDLIQTQIDAPTATVLFSEIAEMVLFRA